MATQNMQTMQLIAPDIVQEQTQLARRQQMADLLRKQSLDPMGGTENIGGWAIKKSPWEGISKLAQGFAANYVQDKTDTRQAELAQLLQGRMGDAFDRMAGNAGMPTSDAGAYGADEAGNKSGPPAPTESSISPVQALRNQAKAAYQMGNNDLANKLIENYSLMTNEAKRDNELGISSSSSRSSELANRLKAGTMSFTPGQMNQLPDGSRIVAPNFDTGVAGGFDPQGNPTASEIPNISIIAANRAGGIKQAEALVADRFALPTKVDAVGGPMAMTPAQQRAAANGGVDPANTGAAMAQALMGQTSQAQMPSPMSATPSAPPASMFKNPMQPRPGDSDRTMIFQNEMKAAQGRLASAATPEDQARANGDIAALGREMQSNGIPQLAGSTQPPARAPQAAAAPARNPGGIALQDDASRAREIATAQADVVRDTSQQQAGKLRGQLTASVDRAIDLLKAGPTSSGAGSMVDSASNFFGKSTKGADLASQLDTLSGWLTSNVPRMEGPQSDKDVANYRIMGAEVGDRTKPVSQRLAAANELKKLQEKYASLNAAETPIAAPSSANKATTSFASLPSPAEFSGKRMRAPDGSIIRSNGKTWIKE